MGTCTCSAIEKINVHGDTEDVGHSNMYYIPSHTKLCTEHSKKQFSSSKLVVSRSIYFKMRLTEFEIRRLAVCFLWLSLPGHYRVTDEAL